MEKKIGKYNNIAWFLIGLGVAISIFGIYQFCNSEPQMGMHELGDFIGGTAGSIWALAGLLFIYVAFLGQKEQMQNQQVEMKMQREELALAREEYAGQRKQMEEQSLTSALQKFDNTFFHLVNLWNQGVAGFEYKKDGETIKGREAFQYFYEEYKNKYETYRGENWNTPYSEKEEIRLIKKTFVPFFIKYRSYFRHYHKNLGVLFDFIDKAENIDDKKKQFYFDIIRSQTTSDEMLLILYASIDALTKFKYPLLQAKWNFMRNLSERELAHPNHKKLYEDIYINMSVEHYINSQD